MILVYWCLASLLVGGMFSLVVGRGKRIDAEQCRQAYLHSLRGN